MSSDTFDSGSGNWIVPVGVTTVTIELWGAGGNGGTSNSILGGGGAGGGGYCRLDNQTVIPGNSVAYSVGAAPGGNTTETTFGLTANGGSDGTIGTGGAPGGFSGGSSGAPGIAGGSGTTSGGDGGAAGGSGGAGGAGGAIGSSGNPGVAPGGGGGGAGKGGAGVVGAGANGRIRFTYTPTGTSQVAPQTELAYDKLKPPQRPIDVPEGLVIYPPNLPPEPPEVLLRMQDDIRLHELPKKLGTALIAMGAYQTPVYPPNLPAPPTPPVFWQQADSQLGTSFSNISQRLDVSTGRTGYFVTPVAPASQRWQQDHQDIPPPVGKVIQENPSGFPPYFAPAPLRYFQSQTDSLSPRQYRAESVSGIPRGPIAVVYSGWQNQNSSGALVPQFPQKRVIFESASGATLAPPGLLPYSFPTFQQMSMDMLPPKKPTIHQDSAWTPYVPSFIPWFVGNPQATYLIPKPPVILLENTRSSYVPSFIPSFVWQSQIDYMRPAPKFLQQDATRTPYVPPVPAPILGYGNLGVSEFIRPRQVLVESVASVPLIGVPAPFIWHQSGHLLLPVRMPDLSAGGGALRSALVGIPWGWMQQQAYLPQRLLVIESHRGGIFTAIQAASPVGVSLVWICDPPMIVWDY